jgi:hypothetical protein
MTRAHHAHVLIEDERLAHAGGVETGNIAEREIDLTGAHGRAHRFDGNICYVDANTARLAIEQRDERR